MSDFVSVDHGNNIQLDSMDSSWKCLFWKEIDPPFVRIHLYVLDNEEHGSNFASIENPQSHLWNSSFGTIFHSI